MKVVETPPAESSTKEAEKTPVIEKILSSEISKTEVLEIMEQNNIEKAEDEKNTGNVPSVISVSDAEPVEIVEQTINQTDEAEKINPPAPDAPKGPVPGLLPIRPKKVSPKNASTKKVSQRVSEGQIARLVRTGQIPFEPPKLVGIFKSGSILNNNYFQYLTSLIPLRQIDALMPFRRDCALKKRKKNRILEKYNFFSSTFKSW